MSTLLPQFSTCHDKALRSIQYLPIISREPPSPPVADSTGYEKYFHAPPHLCGFEFEKLYNPQNSDNRQKQCVLIVVIHKIIFCH